MTRSTSLGEILPGLDPWNLLVLRALTAPLPDVSVAQYFTLLAYVHHLSATNSDPQTVAELNLFFADLVNFGFSDPEIRTVFETVGLGDVIAPIDPLTPEPPIDVDNGMAETAVVALPLGPFILRIGNTFAVGENGGFSAISDLIDLQVSELSSIVRSEIDADADDNDAQQMLAEMVTGTSGANFETEFEPGIDGVELVGLTPDSFTFAFEDGAVEDRLTLTGPGARTVLEDFDTDANVADGTNSISLVDLATETVILGNPDDNPFSEVLPDGFSGAASAHKLLEALTGDDDGQIGGVTLVSVDEASYSVLVDNDATGELDYLVIFDSSGALHDQLIA
jgi:hypothetical protein